MGQSRIFSGLSLLLLLTILSAGTISSQTIPDDFRIDCAPDSGSLDNLEIECVARGCIYQVSLPERHSKKDEEKVSILKYTDFANFIY